MRKSKSLFSSKVTMALGIAGLIGLQGLALAAGGIHAKSGSQMPAPHAQPNGKSLRKGVVKVAATGHSPEGSPFQLTVGLTPGGDGTTCGTDSSVVVNVGDTIDFCYTVTNDSTTAMAYSTLVDSVDGPIFTNMPTAIPAGGGTFVFHRSVTATVSNTYSGTWTSRDLLPGYTPDDTVAAAFVDITSTGTGLGLADDGEVGITIPFSFSFYGVPSNQLCIANNGVIVFGVSTCDVAFSNTALPGTFGGAAIAPFWDDFYQPSGNVYWAVQGTSPNRTVIIEWDRAHYNVGAETSGRAQVEAGVGRQPRGVRPPGTGQPRHRREQAAGAPPGHSGRIGGGRGAPRRAAPGRGRRRGRAGRGAPRAARQAARGGRAALLVRPRGAGDRRDARHLGGIGEVRGKPRDGEPAAQVGRSAMSDACAANKAIVAPKARIGATTGPTGPTGPGAASGREEG